MKTLLERFWTRVDRSGPCWLWGGTISEAGYGTIRVNGRTTGVHSGDNHPSRLHPETRPRGDAHPSRLRPEMLARGVAHGGAKLTDEKVLEIRERALAGIPKRQLARAYGVDPGAIRQIVSRRTWTHVPSASPTGDLHG